MVKPRRPSRQSVFLHVFRRIGGGKGIALLIEAYFDESSEGDSKNGLLSVAGYALDLAGAEGLVADWQQMLSDHNLDYFHMVDCNANEGIFKGFSEAQCDQCARKAIEIARKYPLHGHVYILNQPDYRDILQDRGFDCEPYTFLIWCAFIHVNRWVHENRPDSKISLFFEDRHEKGSRAYELMEACRHDHMSGRNHVASLAFVDKKESEGAQAADLIVWHVRKGYENLKKRKPIRKDTEALIADRRIYTHEFTRDVMEHIRDEFIRKSGSLENASRKLFEQIDHAPDDVV